MRKKPHCIDLYSDTQTRPTPGMRAAMTQAVVGDEQSDDDPTTLQLCEKVAHPAGPGGRRFDGIDIARNEIVCKAITRLLAATTGSTVWCGRAACPPGDAGIYDLLLHSQDRAYSVSKLFEWVEDQHGLNIELTDVYGGRSSYLRHMRIRGKKTDVLQRIRSLPLRRQYAIAEILTGRIITHSFYATPSAACKAPYGDVDYVPMFFHEPTTGPMMEKIFNTNKNNGRTFLLQHAQVGVAFPSIRANTVLES